MTIPFDRFILVAGILLVAVVLIGAGVVYTLRAQANNKAQSPVDDTPAPEWVKTVAGAAGKPFTRPEINAVPADAIVVLPDAVNGGWQVEVNGMRYQSLKDIHDDKAAGKVLAALGGLQQFAGGIPIVEPRPTSRADLVAPPLAAKTVEPGDLIVNQLEPVVVAAMSTAASPTKAKYPAPPGSILEQIEKVLQRNLLAHPTLASRRIHIGAAADGSLLIEVDHLQFKAADEVTDEAARQIIKTAIQEWERTA